MVFSGRNLSGQDPYELRGANDARLAALEAGPRGALAYETQTSNLTGFSTEADLPGCTVTVTVTAGRRLRVTGRVAIVSPTVANDEWVLWINEDGTHKQHDVRRNPNIGDSMNLFVVYVTEPSAGDRTYKLSVERTVGTGTANTSTSADRLGFILIEDIGPA